MQSTFPTRDFRLSLLRPLVHFLWKLYTCRSNLPETFYKKSVRKKKIRKIHRKIIEHLRWLLLHLVELQFIDCLYLQIGFEFSN